MKAIGKYSVLRKLGEGAASKVYLCLDPFAAREVAIKLVSTDWLQHDPERLRFYRKLFLTEAALAGKLKHPHICEIYGAVAEEKLHYVVMEYVCGGTLEQFCRPDALLPVSDVVEIAFKCTRALDFAHRLGITHRDLKPANLLHTGGTGVKVSDFGAALLASADVSQASGVGSPAYMSPEQIRSRELDHRADVYSLGVVMYHLLTGRLPFHAPNDFSLVYEIMNVDPQPPSAYRPDITPALDAVVLRAMEKDRSRRYAHWNDFSLALAAAVRGKRAAAPSAAQGLADSDRFELLRRLAFFEHFTDGELWEVVRVSTWRHAAAGEQVMKEGEPGQFFCIVASGEVKVMRKGRVLNLLGTGQPFGEMSYLTPKQHSRGADVTVMRDADIIFVPNDKLAQLSEGCRHKFDRAFMEILVERLAMANLRLSGV